MVNNFTRALQEYEHRLSNPLANEEEILSEEDYLELEAEKAMEEYKW